MKTAAITLRLSAELAKNLGRIARRRGIPKPQVVREAVTTYLAPSRSEAKSSRITASALALHWKGLPRLTPDEASDFKRDVEAARRDLPLGATLWK